MIKIAINGFGRMGRLAFRTAWQWQGFEIVHINECAGSVETAAHLLHFDSVHGRWDYEVLTHERGLVIAGKQVSYSQNTAINETPWQDMDIDVVVDCTGVFKSKAQLASYFQYGIKKVVVSAPVKEAGVLNVVMGVNENDYDSQLFDIVTAASCTTNCIAPIVKVIDAEFGISHGSLTTIHDMTNTQSILDEYHKDLRRARASALSLIPTSTGSATAITEIFPHLKGRLDGIAVRVPLANASLTDCVFELQTETSITAVNQVLETAANGDMKGILGYESRPLVSVDYTNDSHSATVDALSTMVVNKTQLKLLLWYDNEIGYVHRMMELVQKIARDLDGKS